jgi:hypothetical protein
MDIGPPTYRGRTETSISAWSTAQCGSRRTDAVMMARSVQCPAVAGKGTEVTVQDFGERPRVGQLTPSQRDSGAEGAGATLDLAAH